MTIKAGTRFGSYEVVAQIGAGGMGEVYRARDTRLDRDVALKVLPEEFAQDGQRMARFEREAKLLASLNHPNIAAIHGLEISGPTRALVMELVEGPTLADRIRSGDKMMAVDVTTQPSFTVGKPHLLFEGRYFASDFPLVGVAYDVSADGQRFLMVKDTAEATTVTQINVVLNWSEELKRRVPAGTK
jgi:hypothetical protein